MSEGFHFFKGARRSYRIVPPGLPFDKRADGGVEQSSMSGEFQFVIGSWIGRLGLLARIEGGRKTETYKHI